MGHALGLGQGKWNYDGLTNGTSFLGSHAALAYQLMGGFGNVPLETGGGAGTAGSHWSESVFGSELMTGFISGVPDPLSTVTVGALQDMGYRVNYTAADPYTLGQRLVDGSASVSAGTATGTGASALVAGGDSLARFDSADSPMLMTDYDATTISEVDGPRVARFGERPVERRGAATPHELHGVHAYCPARSRHGRSPGVVVVLRHAAGPSDRLIDTGSGSLTPARH